MIENKIDVNESDFPYTTDPFFPFFCVSLQFSVVMTNFLTSIKNIARSYRSGNHSLIHVANNTNLIQLLETSTLYNCNEKS